MRFHIVLILSLFFLPYFSFGQGPKVKESIRAAIRQTNTAPTPDWWKSLGPSAPTAMMELYKEDKNIHHRVRLLEGLSNFDSPESTAFLKAEASGTKNAVVRNSAIRSVAQSQGMKEESFLS